MNPLWADAILVGFGLIVYVVGSLVYLAQRRQRADAEKSKSWPVVDGTITASAVESSRAKRRATASALVRYGYRVAGNDYQSSRILGGRNQGSPQAMTALIAAYPIGRKVKVHYDPKNPATAALDLGLTNSGTRTLFVYAIAMLVLGFLALAAGLSAFTVNALYALGLKL
ncbi:MAG TPA: DUF3592 domain-containing protein [Xanthobacteraceae bacterium]|jgi:hypothetical protein